MNVSEIVYMKHCRLCDRKVARGLDVLREGACPRRSNSAFYTCCERASFRLICHACPFAESKHSERYEQFDIGQTAMSSDKPLKVIRLTTLRQHAC
jgi:hypothetical protein